MAELVQGQASMNQPGLKSDGLVDALQRARQVTTPLGLSTRRFRVEPRCLDRVGIVPFIWAHNQSNHKVRLQSPVFIQSRTSLTCAVIMFPKNNHRRRTLC
uniref:Uncharacterized protein n=1 Tax=Fundulus heteroclitus TaxID=8078 RepID=A0A3Q2P0M6_FUNHE